MQVGSTKILDHIKIPPHEIKCSLSAARAAEINRHNEAGDKNRAILKHFIDVACHIAIREHGFRGNDEYESSTVQGNFEDQLSSLSKYDTLLELHMRSAFFVVTPKLYKTT